MNSGNGNIRRVGVISDTHGMLRSSAETLFRNVDHIIHAGDIGRAAVLEALTRLAPVTAVRGNMDFHQWAAALPRTASVAVEDVHIYLLHDVCRLDVDPFSEGFGAVIHGHTHRPDIREEKGVLFLNPGAAGPARSDLPPSAALLTVQSGRLIPEIIQLDP